MSSQVEIIAIASTPIDDTKLWVPRVIWEDIQDIDGDFKHKQLRSGLKLMYAFIDEIVFLTLPSGQEKNKGRHYASFLNNHILPWIQESVRPTGEEIYASRCGYLHTGQWKGVDARTAIRFVNWRFARSCGHHLQVSQFRSVDQTHAGVECDLVEFWGLLRQVALWELAQASRNSPDVIARRLQEQAIFISISKKAEAGYVKAELTACEHNQKAEQASEIYVQPLSEMVLLASHFKDPRGERVKKAN